MEKETLLLAGFIITSLIAIGEFIYIIFLQFFYHLSEDKKTEEKFREKIDDPRLRKLIIEKKDKLGLIKKISEFGDGREKEEADKKLETKIKEIGHLEGKFEETWKILIKFEKSLSEAVDVAKDWKRIADDFLKIANDFHELTKWWHRKYEEVRNTYLETKKKHEKYEEELIKSMIDLLFIYKAIACCPKCWNILEFLIRNNWRKFKVKKITQTS